MLKQDNVSSLCDATSGLTPGGVSLSLTTFPCVSIPKESQI